MVLSLRGTAYCRGRSAADAQYSIAARPVLKRAIKRFNQDELGDWVAELECGHARHVRHNPPWQNRPWVLTAAGRSKMIGELIECGLCDRAVDQEAENGFV